MLKFHVLARQPANHYARAMGQRGAKRRRRKVGIALGAGGARGLAHIGVLQTLTSNGVPIDAVVGTSIGAVVGAAFAAGQIDVLERRVRQLDWSQVARMFDPVWPRSGLLSGEGAAEWLASLVGDWRIEDLAVPFAAVAVDLVTGEEVVIREGRVIDAIRASFSIPGVFVPLSRSGRVLVDGALRNPVPASVLSQLGADVRLAVNLHSQPVREIIRRTAQSRTRSGGGVAARVLDTLEDRVSRFRRRRPARGRAHAEESTGGPNLFEVLTASMTIMEHELARYRLALDPVDVLLSPRVAEIRSFEFHKARKAIRAGEREAEAHLSEIVRAVARRRRVGRRTYRSKSLSSPASPNS
jgi:NTE family protein